MKIQALFLKQLDRPINGVVKAEQVANEVVWNELDEYHVTKELDGHLRKFLEAYTASINSPTDNMGVWISGFFGSGKSHFLKILSYLLARRSATHPQSGIARDAVEFFNTKIGPKAGAKGDPALFSDVLTATSKPTDVLLFNIDAKADAKWGRDAVLQVFVRVLNERQGFSSDHPHIAYMERYLQKQGKLDAFHAEFQKRAGSAWVAERDAWHFHEDALRGALALALGKDEAATKAWFDKAEQDSVVTVEKLAAQVKEYLATKGPDQRVVFCADEVGQFIGNDTHLMLNLQTVAEHLGTACQGRAWVIVTSQEDIDAVLGQFRAVKENDFSKIQGRFKTRLSLSSSNTDEVIGARLLEKTTDAVKELTKVFAEKGDILKNQVSFSSTKKKFQNYTDPQSFITAYPFAPYHFELVQKIFESIRKAGATGVHLAQGERSMLDAFQSAALAIKDREVGALVAIHRFYPAIESFLDTTVKRTIDQAKENPAIKAFPEDVELLRALFLIRYVDVLKGTVDNLVTLSLEEIDQDRIALKKKIEASLERLEGQNLISRSGDTYSFLTSEEQDVGREIKNQEISPSDEQRKLAELIYADVLKGQVKHTFKDNKVDYKLTRYCDGQLTGNKKDEDLAVSVVTPLHDTYEAFNPALCVTQSTEHGGQLLVKLSDNPQLLRELKQYLKTDKYVRFKTDESNPETLKRILRDRADENRERDARLREMVEVLLSTADFFAAGNSLKPKSTNVAAQFAEGFDYLVRNTFNKMVLLSHPSKDASAAQAETAAVLAASDTHQQALGLGLEAPNGKALQDLLQYVKLSSSNNHKVILEDLVSRYERRPYGWPTYDVVLLLARLFVAGEITLLLDGQAMAPADAKDPLAKRANWSKVTVRKRATTTGDVLKKARELGKKLFDTTGPDGEQELSTFLHERFADWRSDLQKIAPLFAGGKYPGETVVVDGLHRIEALVHLVEPTEFLGTLVADGASWLAFNDKRQDLEQFFKTQRPTWDDLRLAVDSTYKANLHALLHRASAKAAFTSIGELLALAEPYGKLHTAAALLATLKTENEALLADVRPSAVAAIEGYVGQLKAAIEQAEKTRGTSATAELQNGWLHPLQGHLKTAQTSKELPTIADAQQRAEEARNDALDDIEQWANPKVPKPQRPIHTVTVSSLVKTPYLENERDVDAFLSALKDELLTMVATHRIRIK